MEKIKNNTDFLKLFVRNRAAVIGLTLLIIIILLAFLAPFIYPENPFKTVGKPLLEPFGEFFLGTDRLGRDVAAGVVHGARTSIQQPHLFPICLCREKIRQMVPVKVFQPF
jgi:ABC-type dipeptide/oligopeptide/nickel transport system permease subunit